MKKFLRMIKILDFDDTISLSYIALIAAIASLCARADAYSLAFLCAALANLNAKKWFSYLNDKKFLGDIERLDAMAKQLSRLQQDVDRINAAATLTQMRR